MMLWHKLLWQKTLNLYTNGEQPRQRNSVQQDFLIANLENITTEKVIQPYRRDVQVKEPESLKSFQNVAKTKDCLKKKYNERQFPLLLFKLQPILTKRLKIKRKREKRKRGELLKVAQGSLGSSKEALDSRSCSSLKQLLDAEISRWKQLFSCFKNNSDSKNSHDLTQWQLSTMLATSLRDQNWRVFLKIIHVRFFPNECCPLWWLQLWSFGGSSSI